MAEHDQTDGLYESVGKTVAKDAWKRYRAYRCNATVGPDHRIVLDVPTDFPSGEVNVLVLWDD